MLHWHLHHRVLLYLVDRVEPVLSHLNRCTVQVGPEVNGLDFFFSVPTASPVLCFQFTAGEWTPAMAVDGGRGRKEGGRKRGGINRTEAGNDELRERPLIFHSDRLSSVRRQRRWSLCQRGHTCSLQYRLLHSFFWS